MKLKNKIIVVTGGSGLLGKSILDKIRLEGGTAINADVNGANDLDVNEIQMDITNEESIRLSVDEIVRKHGRIDGWVNNAYPRTKDWGKDYFTNESMESWRANVDMHLGGYATSCQYVLKQMQKQGNGSVVNMASIYGILGADFTVYEGTEMKNVSAYSAIKGGLINLTRFLASYYGPFNVKVNAVSPGGIFDNQNPIFVNNYNKKTPMKRMGTPEEIASGVCFLLSDESSYITGHNLVIDGGWSVV
jgi:NAD(P)-dependent dehydrogenase (short-subunit alcohol dehydrogenase family)